jgi:hypothetical protein
MIWRLWRKRRPLQPPSTPDQHDPSMPDWRDLVVAHVSPGGFVFKGSEDAVRHGFQTVDEAIQFLQELAKTNGPAVASEERIRGLRVLGAALEEAPFSDEYMMRRRLAEGICAASGRRSCLTRRPGPRASRNNAMSPICFSK